MDGPRLAIVCLRKHELGISRILNRVAHRSWNTNSKIKLIAIPDDKATHETTIRNRLYAELKNPDRSIDVVFVGRFSVGLDFGGPNLRWTKTELRAHNDFLADIRPLLEKLQLDWLSQIERILLNAWHHGTINRERLNAWIRQFRQVDNSEWVAELLLKRLDFWGDQRLADAFEFSAETMKAFDCVAVNRRKGGKSADSISNLVKKRCQKYPPGIDEVFDLYEVLTKEDLASKSDRILYIEDGIFSGTEITNYWGALLGDKPVPGRRPKFERTPNIESIKAKTIRLHFPVATSLGLARARRFFFKHSLSNIEITHSRAGLIEVLTEDGQRAISNETFYHSELRNCPRDTASHIRCHAFDDISYWKSASQPNRIDRATEICARIGSCLFENYLADVKYAWPAEKVKQCALGMHGMGLALAFSHSVPKAALPLFWGRGIVTHGKRKFEWLPLFENAI